MEREADRSVSVCPCSSERLVAPPRVDCLTHVGGGGYRSGTELSQKQSNSLLTAPQVANRISQNWFFTKRGNAALNSPSLIGRGLPGRRAQ